MKLALVRQSYTPFGGAERFVERALAALRSQGTDVTIIARRWQVEQTAGGPGFLRCDPFYLGRTWRDAGFARCVQAIIAEGRFDLVQSHERIPGCHIYRAGDGVHATWLELRDRARGVPPWLTLATDRLSPWHRHTLAAEAALFRHPALRAVICNSHLVRDDISRRFPETAGKLQVIYNGIDPGYFHPGLRGEHRARLRTELGIGERTPVILFVGSGFERKGVPALLAALAGMARRDAQLLIVGRDRHEAAMRTRAARLDIGARVRFLGGQRDVRPYYGTADCFVLPTLYDPMPNAALEALACGLPVVTSTSCGAAELIESGFSGFVGDALDVPELARNIDAALALRTEPAAIAAGVAHLGIDLMAGQLTDLYRRTAAAAPL